MRQIRFLILVLCFYLVARANGGGGVKTGSNINWITIWLCFFFGLLFTILFRYLNRRSRKIDQRSDPALPLSGWIIFLGINLVGRMIIQFYFFLTANYFSKTFWLELAKIGGVHFHSLIIFELFLSLFALAGTGALIYWFLGRRDIFPSMFILYVFFYVIATFVLVMLYRNMNLPEEMMSIRRNSLVHLIRIIYAAAWVVFVWKSKQVRKTFVYNG